jgi:hypothetical protein
MVLVGALFGAIVFSLIVGVVLMLIVNESVARRAPRAWLVFCAAAFAVAGGCALAVLYLVMAAPTHSGSPSGDDYVRGLWIAILVGASCGLAVIGIISCGLAIKRLRARRSGTAGPEPQAPGAKAGELADPTLDGQGGQTGRVQLVGRLLIAQGIAEVGMAVVALAGPRPFKVETAGSDFGLFFLLAVSVTLTACGILKIIAGFCNQRLRGRGLGYAALISALLPPAVNCWCAPTGLAIMLYGLVVYSRPDVRAAFARAQAAPYHRDW